MRSPHGHEEWAKVAALALVAFAVSVLAYNIQVAPRLPGWFFR